MLSFNQFLNQYNWLWPALVQSCLVLIIAAIAIFLKNKTLEKMQHTSPKRFGSQIKILAYAAKKPLTLWISLIAFTFIIDILESHLFGEQVFFNWVSPLRIVGMSLIFVWFGARLIRKVEQHFLEHKFQKMPIDHTSILAAGKLLRILVHISGALVILPTIGIPISGVLALGGVGGIAIGFAAKDMVANFLGGAVLYAERPFSVGDSIESTEKDIAGKVISIGWRTTKIRRLDRKMMYVPNSTFSTITLINSSKRTHTRIYEKLSIRYDDINCLPAIVSDLKQMLCEHPDIEQNEILHVGLSELSESALECLIWCFTNRRTRLEYFVVLQDILMQSLQIVAKHGAEMAYPTSTINLRAQTDNLHN